MNRKVFLPELEGIRAYAFIAVFLVHYTSGLTLTPAGPALWQRVWFLFTQISWIAVPIFFVLSGFLITGVLYDSREREGFFSVFYGRRALRILPVYYAVLGLVALAALLTHVRLSRPQLLFLVYLQNMQSAETLYRVGRNLNLAHLWSLAVEEQFYLTWPVVVWLLRDRVRLLHFCYFTVAGSCIVRLSWPMLHGDMAFAYSCTSTRCDALVMGAALALHARKQGFDMRHLATPAKWITISAVLLFYVRVFVSGNSLPGDYSGIALLIPLANIMSLGLVILCLIPGTIVHRLCRMEWACSLGKLSYGLYLIHALYLPFVLNRIAPSLLHARGRFVGRLLLLAGVWSVTYILARISYRYIEMPAFLLKSHFQYGKVIPTPAAGVRFFFSPAPVSQSKGV